MYIEPNASDVISVACRLIDEARSDFANVLIDVRACTMLGTEEWMDVWWILGELRSLGLAPSVKELALLRERGLPDDAWTEATERPNRVVEEAGLLVCRSCGGRARWQPLADAWMPACAAHAPEDDWT